MAHELPYLSSYKNVRTLFEKIKIAKVPEIFTQSFLSETIGLKASSDRPLINLLKNLAFLDSGGRPTPSYSALKNENLAAIEIAQGIKIAYKPLFDANENFPTLNSSEQKGLVAQVSGSDTGTTSKIVGTFRSLAALADFKAEKIIEETFQNTPPPPQPKEQKKHIENPSNLRPEFHYNIQIHLPSNGTEETYLNIFNAIRKSFQ
jgi:hypothetical protein